jgi:serine/threonine protein kinase
MYEQCGTPAYIAPEVSNKNKGYKGFKADMWSAGVCLYVMLIGTVPFRAGSMKELHDLIRKGKYSLQGEVISPEAKNLLSQLINVNYHKRLSAKECLDHPWFKTSQDGKTPMNYDRDDLSKIIFTQKELETIHKDYITRVEKLKKQRQKKEPINSSLLERDPLRSSSVNQITTTFDEDILFTEHNLDTKEDQKQDLFENNPENLFKKQENKEF